MMVARVTDHEPGEFVHTFGGAHLYLDQVEQAGLQRTRQPHPLPRVHLRRTPASIFDFRYGDVELPDYRGYPAIRTAESV